MLINDIKRLFQFETSWDKGSFIIAVREKFSKSFKATVEIQPFDMDEPELRHNGFMKGSAGRILVYPVYAEEMIEELIAQGMFVYTSKDLFVVTAYHYPSSYFGGTLISSGLSQLNY